MLEKVGSLAYHFLMIFVELMSDGRYARAQGDTAVFT